MQVDLRELKEQLEEAIEALEKRRALLLDQIKHVEAVERIAERLERQASNNKHEQSDEPLNWPIASAKKPSEKAPPAEDDSFDWAFEDTQTVNQ